MTLMHSMGDQFVNKKAHLDISIIGMSPCTPVSAYQTLILHLQIRSLLRGEDSLPKAGPASQAVIAHYKQLVQTLEADEFKTNFVMAKNFPLELAVIAHLSPIHSSFRWAVVIHHYLRYRSPIHASFRRAAVMHHYLRYLSRNMVC